MAFIGFIRFMLLMLGSYCVAVVVAVIFLDFIAVAAALFFPALLCDVLLPPILANALSPPVLVPIGTDARRCASGTRRMGMRQRGGSRRIDKINLGQRSK